MKKSLFAIAAVTAFAGAAQAQSSVTVYGIYDGGFNATSTKETGSTGTRTSGQTSGFTGGESATSRIGFRGMEDIGGGKSVNFNLELNIAAGTGEVTTSTHNNTTNSTGANQGQETGVRTSIVGISDQQFGSLAVGRQLTGLHSILAGDVWGGNSMVGDITYSDFNSTPNGAGTTASGRVNRIMTRSSNMVTYTSPTIMGFALRADYGNTETTAVSSTTTGQPGVQFSMAGVYASYTYGPFSAKAGQITGKSNEALAQSLAYTGQKVVINGANAMYKDKGVTVQYTIGNNKVTTETQGLSTHTSGVRAQKLSASYQMGAFMPFVQYGIGGTEGVRTAANTSTEDKAMQVGVEYGLSKRSTLYAVYGNQERSLKTNTTAKTEVTEMSVGLRHTF
jgi:predicted porin